MAAGAYHTCALTSSGGVQCWGHNDYGQVGDGTTTNHVMPVAVTGLASGVATVAAGRYHTCAVTSAGALYCWGSNAYGQLGDGTTTNRSTPVAVSGLTSGVVAVAPGDFHTCAVTSVGAVLCWGANGFGQVGDGTTTTPRLTPVAVIGLGAGAAAVAARQQPLVCRDERRRGAVLGKKSRRTTRRPRRTTDRPTPSVVDGLSSGVATIDDGLDHTCALTTLGAVRCWGDNTYGQTRRRDDEQPGRCQ